VAGASILSLCEAGDAALQKGVDSVYGKAKIEKGIAFPTSVSVNNCVGHFNPLRSDPVVNLQDGDVVKMYSLSPGFACMFSDAV